MSWRASGYGLAGSLLLVTGVIGCRGSDTEPAPSLSPNAQPALVAMLRDDLAAERHPADGGGRAWLEADPEGRDRVRAGETGRWTILYEAGELGIVEGGWLFLQVPPHWGWSDPQVTAADLPGYTEVTTEAANVVLEPATLDVGLLGIRVTGRALAAGERVRVVYGAGPAGARADRFAERRSRFWIAVDGDGDGVRGLLPDPPELNIAPGPTAALAVHLPSVARPGETVRLAVAALDSRGNAAAEPLGEVGLSAPDGGLEQTDRPTLEGPRGVLELTAGRPGVWRLAARTAAGETGSSNPMVVAAGLPRVLWADLHGHSNLSDGTGTPEDYFTYARDVAALDVVALTDHDHWGLRALSRHPELWAEIRQQTERFHQPGRFVTLLGYEWTSWLHGHRHVLYFEDRGEVLSSVDPAYETPAKLWAALRGRPALTFAHHSAGGPIATDWDYPPDPELEPVTEVVSVHGSSEAPDSPAPIYSPAPGNFVRDVLDRGFRLGLVGSGDGHDGHPGLSHLVSATGGLAAIVAEEATREAVLEALRARRVYATNGPRIYLTAELAGRPMGSAMAAAELGGRASLTARVVAPAPLEGIDLVRRGGLIETVDCGGGLDCRLSREIENLRSGGYLYLRARQVDGGAAWSSPFFFD